MPEPLGGLTLRRLFPEQEIDTPGRQIDIDKANFLMLTEDLPNLFGIVGRPANRRVPIRDLEQFSDWLYIMTEPIIVKVFAGENTNAKSEFKSRITSI